MNNKENKKFTQGILKHLEQISPYIPGMPITELKRTTNIVKISKLASNENGLGVSEQVKQIIRNCQTSDLFRYPDSNCFELKQELAKFYKSYKLGMENFAIGNGSNEILELITRIVAKESDEIIVSQYGFLAYPLIAKTLNAKLTIVKEKNYCADLQAIQKAINTNTKIVLIANPNNPTGTAFNKNEFESFIKNIPNQVLIVIDEAYFEYTCKGDYALDGLRYINQYPNLLITRTFSKAYGLAGLRIGYIVANSKIINYLERIREPFNVNSLAQSAAVAALKDREFIKKSYQYNLTARSKLQNYLQKFGYQILKSQANFLTINFGTKCASIHKKLLRLGVITRPLDNYGMSEFLRISIGGSSEMEHLYQALEQVL